MANEPPVGSGPDKITPETPTCPTKNVRCNYWQNGGCRMVCWIEAAGHGRETGEQVHEYRALLRQARDSLAWLVTDCDKRNEFDGGPPEDSAELRQAKEVLAALCKT